MGKPISRLRCAALLVLTVAAAGRAGEAQADILTGCKSGPVAQVFLPWVDPAWYALVPDGGFESGGQGWTLDAGAVVVSGNEPYYVRAAGDARSLALPAGASAATPPMCVSPGHPTLRFFVRHIGPAWSDLVVTVDFVDPVGVRRSVLVGSIKAGAAWMPSPVLAVPTNVLGRTIVVRFSSSAGAWSVDDVYVDPYGKG
jgi:hypothetical protein